METNCGWILQASPIRPRLDEIEKAPQREHLSHLQNSIFSVDLFLCEF